MQQQLWLLLLLFLIVRVVVKGGAEELPGHGYLSSRLQRLEGSCSSVLLLLQFCLILAVEAVTAALVAALATGESYHRPQAHPVAPHRGRASCKIRPVTCFLNQLKGDN